MNKHTPESFEISNNQIYYGPEWKQHPEHPAVRWVDWRTSRRLTVK